jgi:AcrR family transcriptional regulator
MTGDKRREQILLTAVDLFSRRGFSGTTTKEIARASGVSEAMVFRHFATKDVLYDAILDNKGCQAGVQRFPWDESPALREAIEQKDDFAVFYNIALQALDRHQSDEGFMRLLFYSALEEHKLAERFFNEFVSKVYEFISSYVSIRQSDGAMRAVNPKLVVRAFLGMLIHHSINNMLWDKKKALMNITNEEAARSFTEILLKGIEK